MATVGDEVWYVPSVDFAKDRGPNGLAWVFGRRVGVRPGEDPKVVELSDAEADKVLAQIRAGRRGELIPLAPKEPWPAVVAKTDGDKADLDVKHPHGGVTLHLAGVPHDPKGTAGTWHDDTDADAESADAAGGEALRRSKKKKAKAEPETEQ